MLFTPQKPYGVKHLGTGKPICIPLNGHPMSWVEEFKYLGHTLVCTLRDSADMRRMKRSLYYGANRISAKVGYADKTILVQLFKSFCCNMYGCELWSMFGDKKAFNELCVAYHSSLKKIVKRPRSTRNHDLCLYLDLLPCPMHVASRQLSFWRRLWESDNTVVSALLQSDIGRHGLIAKWHLQLRRVHDMISMDLSRASTADIVNVFASKLERFVLDRRRQLDT